MKRQEALSYREAGAQAAAKGKPKEKKDEGAAEQ